MGRRSGLKIRSREA